MPRSGDILPAFGALVVFCLIGYAGNRLGSLPNPKVFPAIYALPWLVRLWMLSEVICEEIMFRGYFIERAEELTGSMWTTATLSCVLFGLAHAPSSTAKVDSGGDSRLKRGEFAMGFCFKGLDNP
jgi:membrane protease YdiL (CAAX protease family)